MTLSLPAADLCRVLAATPVTPPPTAIELPIAVSDWIGVGADYALRLWPEGGPGADGARTVAHLVSGAAAAPQRAPVFRTGLGLADLRSRLRHRLDRELPRLIPGSLIVVGGSGVLLRGPAGSGKSETVLGLLDRGHRLVADDAVSLGAGTHGRLEGNAPATDGGFLLIRGLGPLRLEHHYPGQRLDSSGIDLVVELVAPPGEGDPLAGGWGQTGLMGRALPALSLASGRNLPLLIEAAAREWRQRARGGDSLHGLIDWQQDCLPCD